MAKDYEGKNIADIDELPLLPLIDITMFPFMILPLFVGRKSSIEAVEHALEKSGRMIMLSGQKTVSTKDMPNTTDIYQMGTVALIMRMRKLPDGRIKLLVQGTHKAKITKFKQEKPYLIAKLTKVEDLPAKRNDANILAMMRTCIMQLEQIVALGKTSGPDILTIADDIKDPGRLADLIASNLSLHSEESQLLLEILNPAARLNKVNEILTREIEVLNMQQKLRREDPKSHKEGLLRDQIRAIKSEFGRDRNGPVDGLEDEFKEFQEKITNGHMPKKVEKEALKQLGRLEKMHPDSSESIILRSYLEWMTELPWKDSPSKKIDLQEAREILDRDHFKLVKIKERILEYLAVHKIKGDNTPGPILCLCGPPGVGKTSLGKSIALACGRAFARIALGGIKDEAEIRGHRRTYVGSMPGRFIQTLRQAQVNNPVILLDEIDKLGGDYRGDPANALLEVLDPEQNKEFRDNYLNVPFDLSKIMFIATSNTTQDIPPALQDRLEVLNISGYSEEEKLTLAKKFLIPKQLKDNGISESNINFSEEGIMEIIRHYTSEAGLRNLERVIGSLCRKAAHRLACNKLDSMSVNIEDLVDLLGPAPFHKDKALEEHEIGVSTGLAWTNVGGEILHIEARKMKGQGITLTGSLGEVMRESAQTAIGHIRSRASEFNIDEDVFASYEIHIHVPAGSIPKDGPSAGLALAIAIISLLTETPVNSKVAMTGEITLTGRLLPIGGLKGKSLAAMRANIETILIPWQNQKNLVDIPEEFRDKVKIIPIRTLEEALSVALVGFGKKKKASANKKSRTLRKHKNRTATAA